MAASCSTLVLALQQRRGHTLWWRHCLGEVQGCEASLAAVFITRPSSSRCFLEGACLEGLSFCTAGPEELKPSEDGSEQQKVLAQVASRFSEKEVCAVRRHACALQFLVLSRPAHRRLLLIPGLIGELLCTLAPDQD